MTIKCLHGHVRERIDNHPMHDANSLNHALLDEGGYFAKSLVCYSMSVPRAFPQVLKLVEPNNQVVGAQLTQRLALQHACSAHLLSSTMAAWNAQMVRDQFSAPPSTCQTCKGANGCSMPWTL